MTMEEIINKLYIKKLERYIFQVSYFVKKKEDAEQNIKLRYILESFAHYVRTKHFKLFAKKKKKFGWKDLTES